MLDNLVEEQIKFLMKFYLLYGATPVGRVPEKDFTDEFNILILYNIYNNILLAYLFDDWLRWETIKLKKETIDFLEKRLDTQES